MDEKIHNLYTLTVTEFLLKTLQLMQEENIRLRSSTDIEDLVDSAFAMKCVEEQLAILTKKCKEVRGNIEFKVGQLFISMDVKNIKTEYVTATPTVSQTATPPTFSKNYEAYAEVMRHFGVPEDHIKMGLLQIHYKHFGEYLNDMAAQGRGLPPCIEAMKKHDSFVVRYRKVRD